MAMEDEDDVWAVTTSSSASPPPHPASAAAGFISTALSLNSHLHLLASGGRGSPFHPGDGGFDGCGGYRNAAASPSSFFSPTAASFPHLPPLDTGPAGRALEREMCLGGATAAATAWAGAGCATDHRKKRMIKNRESASRSRARKQAYVTQLESEVQHLLQENEKLRVKYEQLRESVEVPVPVKRTLQRLRSAPF